MIEREKREREVKNYSTVLMLISLVKLIKLKVEVDKIPARLLKETADASAVPLNMLFNLPLNRDACLNYGNQLTSHLLIRMVTGSQWKIVEDREVDVVFHDVFVMMSSQSSFANMVSVETWSIGVEII